MRKQNIEDEGAEELRSGVQRYRRWETEIQETGRQRYSTVAGKGDTGDGK
jgi:putative hemolysin